MRVSPGFSPSKRILPGPLPGVGWSRWRGSDRRIARHFNQALMELGALIQSFLPSCDRCPLVRNAGHRQEGERLSRQAQGKAPLPVSVVFGCRR